MFDEKRTAAELRRYRRRGPRRTSRRLIESIAAQGVAGLSLLDIGGGPGAVQFGLLAAGAREAVDVDASAGYLKAAKQEAERRNVVAQITHMHGNFVDLADRVAPADIVTLDRVICCYDDARGLLRASAAKAKRILGLVYPRDTWWVKLAHGLLGLLPARPTHFRSFIHPSTQVEEIAASQGFETLTRHRGGLWQVVVYAKRERPTARGTS
jgi:magnesium-protoporphyrin O-methyltransferase